MNNYCTNCGKKLKRIDIKCSECGTAVIDVKYLKGKKNKNDLKVYAIAFGGVVFMILSYFFLYPFLLRPLVKLELKNKYDAKNIKINSQSTCYRCTGGCDGSCIGHKLIFNCFEYEVSYEKNNRRRDAKIEIHNWKTDIMYDYDYMDYGNENYNDEYYNNYDYNENNVNDEYYNNNYDYNENTENGWSDYYIDSSGNVNYGG